MEIRRYKSGEERELWELYFNTTHQIVAQNYTVDQVNRWAAPNADMDIWAKRLVNTNPFVAIEGGVIVGLAELENAGHINYFYCHHKWQRKGVGTLLLATIELEAKKLSIKKLYAEVSTTAVDFFKAKGFEITEERVNIVCNAPAKQYLMQKLLDT